MTGPQTAAPAPATAGPGGVAAAGARVPVTQDDLVGMLDTLGWKPGGVLFVQASLRSLGPVLGESPVSGEGPVAGESRAVRENSPAAAEHAEPGRSRAELVASALREAVGPDGTLVAYTATPENSQTSRLYAQATAGLSHARIEEYHAGLPAFDPAHTPCSPTMGRLSEAIRRLPGALRSTHPQTSFAAVGPLAEEITGEHPLKQHLGWPSPLGRLYSLGAQALLLGTDARTFTPFHLVDYQRADHPTKIYSAKVLDGAGRPYWRRFEGLALDDLHFARLGRAVERHLEIPRVPIGGTRAALVGIHDVVDLAAQLADRISTRS